MEIKNGSASNPLFSRYGETGLLNFKSEAAGNEGCQGIKIQNFERVWARMINI